MKFEPTKQKTNRAIYSFLVLAATIIFALIVLNLGKIFAGFQTLLSYIMPLIYGFVLAFLLNPLLKLYQKKLISKIRINKKPLKHSRARVISLVLTYLTAFLLVTLVLWLVLPRVGESLKAISKQIPSYIEEIQISYRKGMTWLKEIPLASTGEGPPQMIAQIAGTAVDWIEKTLRSLSDNLDGIADGILVVAGTLASTVFNFVLGTVVSVYFLIDKEKIFAQLRKVISAIFPEKVATFLYDFAKDTNAIFSGFIVGKTMDSLIVGGVCFIGMLFIHRELAVLIAVLVGIFNMVPYFGPVVGGVISGLLLLAVNPGKAIAFAIFIVVLMQVDSNIIEPRILGNALGVSPLMVIFSIFLFTGILGVPGVFLGVPLFSMFYLLAGKLVNYLLKKRKLSLKTKDYASEENPYVE